MELEYRFSLLMHRQAAVDGVTTLLVGDEFKFKQVGEELVFIGEEASCQIELYEVKGTYRLRIVGEGLTQVLEKRIRSEVDRHAWPARPLNS